MNNLVQISLLGVLGDNIGKTWNLNIKSVGEALRAINTLTKNKLFYFLYENDKKGLKYSVLINNREIDGNYENIAESELVLNYPKLKNIDIIPVIEGADPSGFTRILQGIALIAAGSFVSAIPGLQGVGGALIQQGATLVGTAFILYGVATLITMPPDFSNFKEIGGSRRSSFLFDGPQNTIREGLPVPIIYGEILAGSAVIAASYTITDIHSNPAEQTI